MVIREDVLGQLDTAQKIRDIFFSPQNGLGAQFAVETVALSGNKRRSVLNLDGQLVDYAQGRNYTAHLVWPNNMREGNESKLTLVGAGKLLAAKYCLQRSVGAVPPVWRRATDQRTERHLYRPLQCGRRHYDLPYPHRYGRQPVCWRTVQPVPVAGYAVLRRGRQ